MSHLVTIQTEIKDPVALASACRRLGLEQPVEGKADIFVEKARGGSSGCPAGRTPL